MIACPLTLSRENAGRGQRRFSRRCCCCSWWSWSCRGMRSRAGERVERWPEDSEPSELVGRLPPRGLAQLDCVVRESVVVRCRSLAEPQARRGSRSREDGARRRRRARWCAGGRCQGPAGAAASSACWRVSSEVRGRSFRVSAEEERGGRTGVRKGVRARARCSCRRRLAVDGQRPQERAGCAEQSCKPSMAQRREGCE